MRAVAAHTRCPLYLHPEPDSELADELLTGWAVELTSSPAEGWYEVCTDYGYTGFARAAGLITGPLAERWEAQPRRTVFRGVCSVLSGPSVQAPQRALLLRGAAVALTGRPTPDGWQPVALPDGIGGWIRSSFLGDIPAAPLPEADFRRAVTAWAGCYLGTQYLWGGKSPLGIDCSGLTFMAYRLSGVTIWRDAQIRPGYPIHPIPMGSEQPGDLLYFPGHVALCLPGGAYIHATAKEGSDGVVVNSLDPRSPLYRPDLPDRLLAVGSLFGT